jgi:hypothetical protein
LAYAGIVDGATCFVGSHQDDWELLNNSSATPVAGLIVQAQTSATARWHRKLTGSPNWTQYAEFYLNATTGNDENLGTTAGAALRSWDELMYRWNHQRINRLVTVFGMSSLGAIRGKIHLGPQGMVVLDMWHQATLQASLTVSAAAGLSPATHEFNTLSCSGVASWAAYLGMRTRLTSGANVGALSWVAIQNPHAVGDSVARMSWWTSMALNSITTAAPTGATNALPTIGNTLALETLGTLADVALDVVAEASLPTDSQWGVIIANASINSAGTDGTSISITTHGGAKSAFYGCQISGSVGGEPKLYQCRVLAQASATYINDTDVVGCLLNANPAWPRFARCTLASVLAQTCPIEGEDLTFNYQSMSADRVGSAGYGVLLDRGYNRCTANNGLFGDGNYRAGLSLSQGAILEMAATPPTITATLADVRLYSENVSWAEAAQMGLDKKVGAFVVGVPNMRSNQYGLLALNTPAFTATAPATGRIQHYTLDGAAGGVSGTRLRQSYVGNLTVLTGGSALAEVGIFEDSFSAYSPDNAAYSWYIDISTLGGHVYLDRVARLDVDFLMEVTIVAQGQFTRGVWHGVAHFQYRGGLDALNLLGTQTSINTWVNPPTFFLYADNTTMTRMRIYLQTPSMGLPAGAPVYWGFFRKIRVFRFGGQTPV